MTEKQCTKCGEVKSLDEFAVQSAARGGRRYACRQCVSIYSAADKARAKFADYCSKNRPKRRASDALHYAKKIGVIIPEPCEVCGSGKSEAHHDSYLREDWLTVRWLCRLHHKAWHAEHGEGRMPAADGTSLAESNQPNEG
jgi:hypothetical protein